MSVSRKCDYSRRKFDTGHSSRVELFPLPAVAKPDPPAGRSVHAQRRFDRKLHIWREASHAVDALNLLYVCRRDFHPGRRYPEELALAHRQVHKHVIRRIAEMRPRSIPTATEAAREILGSCYDYMGSSCTVVPYDETTVSLPEALKTPVSLASVLAPGTWAQLSLGTMLADDDVVEWRRRDGAGASSYTDERMRSDPDLMRSFALRLLRCGVAGVTATCKEEVTLFFVTKKGGRQRLVLDCRRVNEVFRSPPSPDLGSGECFSRLCTAEREGVAVQRASGATDDGPATVGDKTVFFADVDLKNCLYQCGMPLDWCDCFVLLKVS